MLQLNQVKKIQTSKQNFRQLKAAQTKEAWQASAQGVLQTESSVTSGGHMTGLPSYRYNKDLMSCVLIHLKYDAKI